jgi:23S rRNA pseudouridine2605 synthase
MLERIQKIISAAGVTSRRAAEQLITEGRVRVNGQVVTELGTKADPSKDHIKVDGKLINPHQPQTYLMLNKPAGFVTTMSDPEGRPTVQDLLKGVKVRVYPVGRLDYNTEGLLLLTNDGDFAHLITHPQHEFPKTYLAKVKGVLEDSQIDSLEKGIYLDDGKTAPAKIKKIRKEEANSWLEITIHEGRKRQVRRMFDRVGHSVIRLKRIRTGNQTLGDLPEGSFRYLTNDEVTGLKELALKSGVGGQERGAGSQEPGVRSQKTAVRPKRAVHAGRDEPRLVNARGTKKPAHRGAKADARPWRAEFTKRDAPGSRVQGRGVMSGSRRPAIGARGQETGVGRARTPAMQDTREGLRRNQVVKASAPQQKKSFNGSKAAERKPRGDSTYSPTSRPAANHPAGRTDIGRPAGKGVSRRPETRRKPAARSWPDSGRGRSDSRGKGAWPGAREAGQRPVSGPRPNKSMRTNKGPRRASRPAGSRGPGQGAGKRGPRR